MMKWLLLLILWLLTGCETFSQVKNCQKEWFEFICKYPKTNENYGSVNVFYSILKLTSNQKDVWVINGNISVYHDTKHKIVRVAVRDKDRRNVKYKCTFKLKRHLNSSDSSDSSEDNLKEVEGRESDISFKHTAYINSQTTITCNYEGAKHQNNVKVFYKENISTCKRILPTNLSSDVQSNGRFSLTETNRGFNVSITDVSTNDAGVYWCGVESDGNSTPLGKIQLEVKDITTTTVNLTAGQDFTYLCDYPSSTPKKFLCKGEDPSTCERLASTSKFDKTRFSMKEDKTKSKVTITMRHVTVNDTGTYWCGAESNDRKQDNQFFHRLVLTAGSETFSQFCQKGWFEFICKYPKTNENYRSVDVSYSKLKLTSNRTDVWVTNGNISVYHDTKHKIVKVAVRDKDPGDVKNRCTFLREPNSSEKNPQPKHADGTESDISFKHTAYIKAQTTITCNYEGAKHQNNVKVFYKENISTCEKILPTNFSSDVQSNGRFSLTETNRGFNVSIIDVSTNDAGVYWCGVESDGNSTPLGKIQLEVKDINTSTVNLRVGQDFTYLCKYPPSTLIKKFLCKGEDPITCERQASTSKFDKTARFSMKDDKAKSKATITMRHVTVNDTGTYWCGAESNDRKQDNQFFHRQVITAVYHGVLEHPATWTIIIAAAASAAGLVLVLLMVLICKRCQHSKKTKDGEAGTTNEDTAYEEIPELPHKSNRGTALKTVYTTADYPSNPSSASHHYSNIHFKPDSGAGDAPPVMVTFPKYSAANHPARLPQDPFYSTVTQPQP